MGSRATRLSVVMTAGGRQVKRRSQLLSPKYRNSVAFQRLENFEKAKAELGNVDREPSLTCTKMGGEDGEHSVRNHYRVKQVGDKIEIVYDEGESSRFVLSWDSKVRRAWDMLVVLAVLYLSFNIPIKMAFTKWKFPKELDTVLEYFFYVDILLNFRTGFVHHGEHVTDPKEIAIHYARTWLFIDLLASFPFEMVLGIDQKQRKGIKILKWLKIPKLLRVARLLKLLKRNVRYYRIFVTVLAAVFSIHLLGCFWLIIIDPCFSYSSDGRCCSQEEMLLYYQSALYVAVLMIFSVADTTSFFALVDRGQWKVKNCSEVIKYNGTYSYGYVDSDVDVSHGDSLYGMIYWSNWTIFDDDRSRQVLNVWVLASLSVVLGIYLVVQVTAQNVLFAQASANAYFEYYNKVDRMKKEMEKLALPHDLQYRVSKYYDYLWMNQKHNQGATSSGILQDFDLSIPLRKEIALHIHGPFLKQIAIFQSCSADSIFAIAMRLKLHVYMPSDVVFYKGDIARELFLIRRGLVSLIKDKAGEEEFQMGPGSYFGELSLILSTPRSRGVKADTMCELCELSKDDFEQCVQEFPRILDDTIRIIEKAYPHRAQEARAATLVIRRRRSEQNEAQPNEDRNSELGSLTKELGSFREAVWKRFEEVERIQTQILDKLERLVDQAAGETEGAVM